MNSKEADISTMKLQTLDYIHVSCRVWLPSARKEFVLGMGMADKEKWHI